jgi:hypothetical protein
MNAIKDSVHDYVTLGPVAQDLLDTRPVQRLRHVKQLSTVRLVYPSANHTRFEHSLGVYHLADRALDHMDIGGDRARHVRAAALLHDIGHGPYGHQTEEVIMRHTGIHHDEIGDLLRATEAGAVLEAHGLDPDRVARIVRGEGQYGQLVSGELDVDRMDYLVRDAHHTGVPYGTIDHGRLVRELVFVDGELVLDEGNVQTAESLLLARALMNPTVYQHHVARISKAMLRRASERLLDVPDITAEQLRRMDDHELLVALRRTDATADFAERLRTRSLYKRAVWAEMRDVPDAVFEMDHEEIRAIERTVAGDLGLGADDVIVDVPPKPSMTESSSRVMVNGEIRQLEDQSPLVSALRTAQGNQWRLGVYCPPTETDAVGGAAADALGLDVDGALVSTVSHSVHATLDEFS